MVRAMRGVQLKHGKISKDLMLLLDLNEPIDQLAMVSNIPWYGPMC